MTAIFTKGIVRQLILQMGHPLVIIIQTENTLTPVKIKGREIGTTPALVRADFIGSIRLILRSRYDE